MDDTYLREFVLPAMDTKWTSFEDCPGGPPTRRPYDEEYYLDRYVPDPALLPPRHFVKLNLDNDPDFEPVELWLDAYGRKCPPPDTGTASTPPRAKPQSPLSSLESTSTSKGADSTAGTATIPASSFASTLDDTPT